MVSCYCLIRILLIALFLQECWSESSSFSGIPRSKTSSAVRTKFFHQYDLWDSEQIDDEGFVSTIFSRKSGWGDPWSSRRRLRRYPLCRIRQVPGDGSCLFHSLSLCLHHALNGTHWDMKSGVRELFEHSRLLRQSAVDCLADGSRKLFVQGGEWLTSKELLDIAASQYNMTGRAYCRAMRDEAVWGGGPEIVALSNVLRRPIHIYELCTLNKQSFCLRRMACFGSPEYDDACAIHVLSADARFPDIAPGKQNPVGNHFLAVFPMRKDIRGGELTEEGSEIVVRGYEHSLPTVLERFYSYVCFWWDCLAEIIEPEDERDESDNDTSGS